MTSAEKTKCHSCGRLKHFVRNGECNPCRLENAEKQRPPCLACGTTKLALRDGRCYPCRVDGKEPVKPTTPLDLAVQRFTEAWPEGDTK